MKDGEYTKRRFSYFVKTSTIVAVFLFGIFVCRTAALAVNLNVAGPNGENIGGYRWLVEEDVTYHAKPPVRSPDPLAINFHKSYMPVAAAGHAAGSINVPLDPTKHYYISILPDSGSADGGYSIGGASVSPQQTSVLVTVNKLPFPAAQITVFVFEDNNPINNAPEPPEEQGLSGFKILLFDAGGRYGISGGQISQDAFGNPLGTTYNPDGSVDQMGSGIITTDANGAAVIKNLAPGKYGIQAVPPAGQGWQQTSTIEGTKTIDAWVKANEPPYFMEFGPPGWHVFVGFIKPTYDTTVLTGGSTLSGNIVNLRLSRPPDATFHSGVAFEHTTPWVGLNILQGGRIGRGVYAQRTGADGAFTIPDVPPGSYQLVVWDDNLDLIIASLGVTVNPDGSCLTTSGSCNFGDVPVFNWFTALHNYVFYDANGDGMWNPGELPMSEQAINLRFRDGSIFQSLPTDFEGFAPFDEAFPFFNWLVAEVDFARFKATGVTVVVDAGGPVAPSDPWSYGGLLNPQLQPKNSNQPFRVETGPVLTQAFQGFIGQTSVLEWGKKEYDPGENGGISGIVYYASTRAENDPAAAVADTWEPGIPRVQVNLYSDANIDGVIDDINGNGTVDIGDALQSVTTDSWDDNLPENCPGDPLDPFYMSGKCYDGMRNWNQVRPGVFDGGYAFDGVPSGAYIVEAVPPQGYQIVKEEDKNVDFGDTYVPVMPEPLFPPPACVGYLHMVPEELTLFPGIPAPYAGQERPLCDLKQIRLSEGKNAAVDFYMFTEVPIAGHIAGMILDDTANEFDPSSPQFGEKYAPPFMPISIRDWTGREISRIYSDQWGKFNTLVPSTYSANLPMPSGFSPNMITACMNDPGPIPDPANPGRLIQDPFYRQQYSQFCYTLQYMPGTTTYLDTPVVRVAAFAGPDQFPLDCEFPNGTPRIYSVSGQGGSGPYVSSISFAGKDITINAVGPISVPNPAYDGPGGVNPPNITRDYGFGATRGTVKIGNIPLAIRSWSNSVIRATVPLGATTGQLTVTRGDNKKSTIAGVTVTVGPTNGSVRNVTAGMRIQDVIDIANPGDLILVQPGRYEELVVMWKPVRLQGWGEGSVTISAIKTPAEKLQQWRDKVQQLITDGVVDLLPGQEIGFGGIEPVTLFNEEGPGIIVLAKDASPADGGFGFVFGYPNSRIDGFTITGADHAGGIMVNGYARYLEISNNRIVGNSGFFSGGIRLGHPVPGLDGTYMDAENNNIRIHNNHITQNGGLGGAGGGMSFCTGSDSYDVSLNYICGNFTLGDGGGIGHYGLSDGGKIINNYVIFNQSFNQGLTVSGGGVFIGGGAPAIGSLTEGSGTVKITSNLIQGNMAGAGDGGGIRTSYVNGQDILLNPDQPESWHTINIFNNIIVNNIAGLAGGGISMQDTVRINIAHNTIANNDSTATSGQAFTPGSPNQSNPQPSGVVSRSHSPALRDAFGLSPIVEPYREFANPYLVNNIIRHNRSFYFLVDNTTTPATYLLKPNVAAGEPPVYKDLAVLGTDTPSQLRPMYSLLTDTTGYDANNISGNPMFMSVYFNGARSSIVMPENTTAIQPAPAFDEGGNFIDVQFGPLTLTGDYHINSASAAMNAGDSTAVGIFPDLAKDYDGQQRPNPVGARPDIGADETIHTFPGGLR